MRVTYGRGSVLRWWRSKMLCTSGFMDGVIFAHKPSLLDVTAQLKCLGLGYKMCAVIPLAGQRTHGTTFWALKLTSQVETRGRNLRSMTALLEFVTDGMFDV